MAAVTPSAIQTDGKLVADMSGAPLRLTFTLGSTSDTYTHPTTPKAWAFIPDPNDLHNVAESAGVFTISSVTGVSKVITLLIWPAIK